MNLAEIENYRKDLKIEEELCGHPLQFITTWGLFSPKSIDEGSRMLLDNMQIRTNDTCLDIGCGYGPLGITMAKQAPQGTSVMIDKDFVAIDYTKKNVQLNGLSNCEVFLSNGLAQVGKRKFSLITSNLPAKVGNEMLSLYMLDTFNHLESGGRFYVVTISGMRKFIQRSFNEFFGNYKKIKQGKTYTVAMAVKD